MDKVLEKSLKDARKEGNLTLGAKQVLNSIKDSKLVVLSRSTDADMVEKITSGAKHENVPLIHFEGTSVALGKMCGLQFRTSVAAFKALVETNINSILKSTEPDAGDKTDNDR